MPRPKRSKVPPTRPTSSLRKIESKKPTESNLGHARLPFNDLYDVSDREYGSDQSLSGIKRPTGRGKSHGVGPPAQELLDKEERGQPLKEEEKNRGAWKTSQKRLSDSRTDSSPKSPAVEIGRKEQRIPNKEGSIFTMDDNIRTQDSTFHSRKKFTRSNSGNIAEKDAPTSPDSVFKTMGSLLRNRQTTIAQEISSSPPLVAPYNNDDEEGFSFDASTPVNLSDIKNMTAPLSASSPQSKKRKHPELQVPRSSFQASSPILSGMNDFIPATNPDSEKNGRDVEAGENLIPSYKESALSPHKHGDIMAPPHSSSSIQLSPVSPKSKMTSRNLRHPRAKTPLMEIDTESDISSTPSLTHSPDISSDSNTKSRHGQQELPPLTLSTAQLKALLPRRRQCMTRDTSDDDIDDRELDLSGLASDEDELAHLEAGLKPANCHSNGLNAASKRKSAPPKNEKLKSQKRPNTPQTYSPRSSIHSDQSDDVDEIDLDSRIEPLTEVEKIGEISQEMQEKIGRELERANQKFKEVDMWQLDFEDVTASNSSPSDSR